MRVIRIILIVVLVYYLAKWITSLIYPYLFKKYQKDQQSQYNNTRNKKKKEGEVTIDYTPKNDKQFDKDSGDYIDYEEVSDE